MRTRGAATFETKRVPAVIDGIAPDGSKVRLLLRLAACSTAQFELGPGEVSTPVTHRTVEEIWYFVSGRGEMWRRHGDRQETVLVEPGVCLTIPLGTEFQFRAFDRGLAAFGVTVPAWPGDGEALVAEGPWTPTVPR